MIRIEGLRKTYGGLVAVDDLSLEVEAGRIFALLGPNGAGKTTTVRALVGLLEPDAGRVEVDGVDARARPEEARRRLGYVPEVAAVYDALTPAEYLALKGRLFGMDEPAIDAVGERLLAGFDLLDRRHEPMAGFSKGMVQKVVLASALLTDPRVLVLDEPLSGLDVETTLVVKEVMREFARRGGTLLYCSHLLDVVETLADRVAVLDRGRLQAVGSLDELRAQAGAGRNQRLEQLFQRLTSAADPVARARALLEPGTVRPPTPGDAPGGKK